DLDPDMVAYCRANGLAVEQADAAAYLETLGDGSLGGIFAAHLIEHVEIDYLTRLIALCYRKLRPSAPLVLMSPNPLNLAIYHSWFYADPTHRAPVHPSTLRHLLEQAGFSEFSLRLTS